MPITSPATRRSRRARGDRPPRRRARGGAAQSRPGRRAARCRWCSIRASVGLIGHLLGAITGAAIARKTSFLLDRSASRSSPTGITIRDDPHRPRGLRSRPFDGEGLPVSPTEIVARRRAADLAARQRLGAATGARADRPCRARRSAARRASARATSIWRRARSSRDDLIARHQARRLRHRADRQGVNGVTGDYSRGASGFLIENGEIATPVAEITIAGNLIDMFRALTAAERSRIPLRDQRADAADRRDDGRRWLSSHDAGRRDRGGGGRAMRSAAGGTDFGRWEKAPGNPVCEVDLDGRRAAARAADRARSRGRLAVGGDRRRRRPARAPPRLGGRSDRRHARLSPRPRPAGRVGRAGRGGQPVLGVLDAPARERGVARRARARARRATASRSRVSGRASFAGARVPTDTLPKVDRDLVAVAKPNSIALRIAMVAAGEADLRRDAALGQRMGHRRRRADRARGGARGDRRAGAAARLQHAARGGVRRAGEAPGIQPRRWRGCTIARWRRAEPRRFPRPGEGGRRAAPEG